MSLSSSIFYKDILYFFRTSELQYIDVYVSAARALELKLESVKILRSFDIGE